MTEREFEPYFLEICEGCWHVVGHCRLRKSIRDFRISRIEMLKLTNQKFIRPENFYETYKTNRFDKLSGEERVVIKLLFTGHAARLVKEYESYKADILIKTEQGLLFERAVPMSPEIIKWILGFGAEVTVLEPETLRDEVLGQIKKMGEVYLTDEGCPR
jgi:proteasome accessory factor B